MIGARSRPEEVIPGKDNCQRATQARDAGAVEQQVLYGAPSAFLGADKKIPTRGQDVRLAETTHRVDSCSSRMPLMAAAAPQMQSARLMQG